MLVLTRKYQEKIRIGDNITITVLRTKGKAVRLGIEAPSDVPVIRGELAFEAAEDVNAEVDSQASTPAPKRPMTRQESISVWPVDAPTTAARLREPQQASQVEMKRIPRAQMNGYLPNLVAGAGPLRAMMEQR